MKYEIRLNGYTVKTGITLDEAKELVANLNSEEMAKLGMVAKIHAVMNTREKIIDKLIKESVSEWIGGYENTLQDYPEDSEEYKKAEENLNHDTLFELIYKDVMDGSKRNWKSDIRFVGKKFIEDRIERHLARSGYGK